MRSLLALTLVSGTAALLLAEPAWWVQRGVRDPAKAPSDYAVLNQGQLKNLARAARDEMNANLLGGAGPEVESLVNGWSPPTVASRDFSTVNVGQLKAVASVFYMRLIQAGMAAGYPWSENPVDDVDYAVANLGQAKALFSFDLVADTDGDGISDLWEITQFGSLDRSTELDADGDGIPDTVEFGNGTDAFAWDSNGNGISDAVEAAQNAALLAEANVRLFQKVE